MLRTYLRQEQYEQHIVHFLDILALNDDVTLFLYRIILDHQYG